MAEDRRRRTESGGPRTEDGRPTTEDENWQLKILSRRSPIRGDNWEL